MAAKRHWAEHLRLSHHGAAFIAREEGVSSPPVLRLPAPRHDRRRAPHHAGAHDDHPARPAAVELPHAARGRRLLPQPRRRRLRARGPRRAGQGAADAGAVRHVRVAVLQHRDRRVRRLTGRRYIKAGRCAAPARRSSGGRCRVSCSAAVAASRGGSSPVTGDARCGTQTQPSLASRR
jgi:hypothetical protein